MSYEVIGRIRRICNQRARNISGIHIMCRCLFATGETLAQYVRGRHRCYCNSDQATSLQTKNNLVQWHGCDTGALPEPTSIPPAPRVRRKDTIQMRALPPKASSVYTMRMLFLPGRSDQSIECFRKIIATIWINVAWSIERVELLVPPCTRHDLRMGKYRSKDRRQILLSYLEA
jgi:hypothetical protein